jgi:hypothetical protein
MPSNDWAAKKGGLGIGVYPADGLDAETRLKNADLALFSNAKAHGRSNRESFGPNMMGVCSV